MCTDRPNALQLDVRNNRLLQHLPVTWPHPPESVTHRAAIPAPMPQRPAPSPVRGPPPGSRPAPCGQAGATAGRRSRSRRRGPRPAGRAGTACVRTATSSVGPVGRSTIGRSGYGWPSAARSAGRTNTSNETCELTGLPGSVTTATPPSTRPAPCGPPGCMPTLTNSTPAPGQRVLDHLVRPGADTPPEVSTRSTPASRSRSRRGTPPRRPGRSAASSARPPASCTAAASIGPFDS